MRRRGNDINQFRAAILYTTIGLGSGFSRICPTLGSRPVMFVTNSVEAEVSAESRLIILFVLILVKK